MRVLDVAAGTGLVTREALAVVGAAHDVIGLDPSAAMMRSGLQAMGVPLVQGTAERLPFADAQFDFVSLGFALRHVADLGSVFREFRRVLRPRRACVSARDHATPGAWRGSSLKFYMGYVVPLVSRAVARHADTPVLF